MATNFPGSLDSYTTKTSGTTIEASHVNDLQDAVEQIEGVLGANAGWGSIGSVYADLLAGTNTDPGHSHTASTVTLSDTDINDTGRFAFANGSSSLSGNWDFAGGLKLSGGYGTLPAAADDLCVGAGGTGPNTVSLAFGDNTDGHAIRIGTDVGSTFTPKFSFMSHGRFGVGTASPGSLIHVLCDQAAVVTGFFENSATTPTVSVLDVNAPNSSSDGFSVLKVRSGGADSLNIRGDRKIFVGGTAHYTGSTQQQAYLTELNSKNLLLSDAEPKLTFYEIDDPASPVAHQFSVTGTKLFYKFTGTAGGETTIFQSQTDNLFGATAAALEFFPNRDAGSIIIGAEGAPVVKSRLTVSGHINESHGSSSYSSSTISNTADVLGSANFTDVDDGTEVGAGSGGTIFLGASNTDNYNQKFAAIRGFARDLSNNTLGDICFLTREFSSDSVLEERLRLTAAGNMTLTRLVSDVDMTGKALSGYEGAMRPYTDGTDRTVLAIKGSGLNQSGSGDNLAACGALELSNNFPSDSGQGSNAVMGEIIWVDPHTPSGSDQNIGIIRLLTTSNENRGGVMEFMLRDEGSTTDNVVVAAFNRDGGLELKKASSNNEPPESTGTNMGVIFIGSNNTLYYRAPGSSTSTAIS